MNNPAAEQFGRVFRDVARRQQLQILPDRYPFLQRQSSLFPVKIAGRNQSDQKIGRRHRVSADEDLGGHTLIGLEETDHVTSRVAKSEPIEMTGLRRCGRWRVGSQYSFHFGGEFRFSSVNPIANRQREQLKLIGHRISVAADDLEIDGAGFGIGQAADDLLEILLARAFRSNRIGIQLGQFAGRHKPNSGNGANVVDVFGKTPEGRVGLFGRPLGRRFPLLARRIGAASEIHAVPKFFVHPFARMVVDADESAAFAAQPVGHGRHFLPGWRHGCRIVQVHARGVLPHVIDHQRAGIPKWFFIQSNVRPFIHVAGHAARRDADVFQRGEGLGRPRRAGLAVTRQRFDAQDAPHVGRPAAFASDELSHAIQQTGVGEIL